MVLHKHPRFLISFVRMDMLHDVYCRNAERIGWDRELDNRYLNRLRQLERLAARRVSEKVRERLLADMRNTGYKSRRRVHSYRQLDTIR
jgi:hypothetical protein